MAAAKGPGLDRASAEEIYNYTLSGGIVVSNALLDSNGTTVILDTTPQTRGSLYTLMVEGISDMSGNGANRLSGSNLKGVLPKSAFLKII